MFVCQAGNNEKQNSIQRSFVYRYSIRINDQWRIIFKWNSGNATQVEIIDYH
jgi:plasmid maintenance system killer protein